MNSKLLGGILLIVGTTIGAGMLALPLATAEIGFWGSLVLLVSCWALMTACGFIFLEVNFWLPPNTNLISMAGRTLGIPGQVIAWVAYLLLLYSVLAAYIAGGGDILHYLFQSSGLPLPQTLASILFTLILGAIVYMGIQFVDYANRAFMLGKMTAYVLLVILIMPFISLANLSDGQIKHITQPSSISIAIVSFTGLMIIPSLRTYFNNDIKLLRKAILIGTFIPLVCYIAWDAVIMGVIPIQGPDGLLSILHSTSSTSSLVSSISILLHTGIITVLAKFFTSICMATSFLAVGVCLSDFIADGLRVKKQGINKNIVFGATFIPPIIVALYYPNAFLTGLNYAGLCCFVLMVLFPPLMAWRGRYHMNLAQGEGVYRVGGGKFLLAVLVIFAILMIGFGVGTVI